MFGKSAAMPYSYKHKVSYLNTLIQCAHQKADVRSVFGCQTPVYNCQSLNRRWTSVWLTNSMQTMNMCTIVISGLKRWAATSKPVGSGGSPGLWCCDELLVSTTSQVCTASTAHRLRPCRSVFRNSITISLSMTITAHTYQSNEKIMGAHCH